MQDIVGIDIGSYAIKLAHLSGRGSSFTAKSVASVYNPAGQFLPSEEMQLNQLAGVLHQLAQDQKLLGKPVATSLPESLAYTSIVSMPYLSDAELASSIHWEAEQHIPVPLDEVQLEYQVLHKPKKGSVGEKMQVLLVASKREVVNRVLEMFQLAGLELVHLETGLLSTYRALASLIPADQAVGVVNMGALSTDMLVVDKGKMVLSYTIQTGGLMLTRSVQQILGLTGQQAEEYKRAYGYDPSQLEGKVKQALDPVMNVLGGELRKAVQYYQTSQSGNTLHSLYLTGGTSYLRGLAPYLSELLSTEVIVVNPFQNISIDQDLVPKDVAAFGVAAGLSQYTEK